MASLEHQRALTCAHLCYCQSVRGLSPVLTCAMASVSEALTCAHLCYCQSVRGLSPVLTCAIARVSEGTHLCSPVLLPECQRALTCAHLCYCQSVRGLSPVLTCAMARVSEALTCAHLSRCQRWHFTCGITRGGSTVYGVVPMQSGAGPAPHRVAQPPAEHAEGVCACVCVCVCALDCTRAACARGP